MKCCICWQPLGFDYSICCIFQILAKKFLFLSFKSKFDLGVEKSEIGKLLGKFCYVGVRKILIKY